MCSVTLYTPSGYEFMILFCPGFVNLRFLPQARRTASGLPDLPRCTPPPARSPTALRRDRPRAPFLPARQSFARTAAHPHAHFPDPSSYQAPPLTECLIDRQIYRKCSRMGCKNLFDLRRSASVVELFLCHKPDMLHRFCLPHRRLRRADHTDSFDVLIRPAASRIQEPQESTGRSAGGCISVWWSNTAKNKSSFSSPSSNLLI